MKKQTLIASLIAAASVAHAADTTEFKWNAELRTRFQSDDNTALAAKPNITQKSYFEQRNKLGLHINKGEGLAAHVTLLNNMDWGRGAATGQPSANDTAGGLSTANTAANRGNDELFVSEAFAWWKLTDNIGAKFGRMGVDVADGSVVAMNDWLRTPFTFDGAGLIFDYDFAKFSVIGVKARELDNDQDVTSAGILASGQSGSVSNVNNGKDPEKNFYGLSVDVKNLPEFLKVANVHYIQQNKDERTVALTTSGTAFTTAQTIAAQTIAGNASLGRYGITLAGDHSNFDYNATYAGVTGKYKYQSTLDKSVSANMWQVGAGYKFVEAMNLRLGVRYHVDSGNDAGTTTSTSDVKRYQPFYYDANKYNGQMQLIGWGNLTMLDIDVTIQPSDMTTVGLSYMTYSRTSDKDTAFAPSSSSETGTAIGSATVSDKDIGSEVNLFANHQFDNVWMQARYGLFMPGSYIKNSIGSGADVPNAQKIFVESKLTF